MASAIMHIAIAKKVNEKLHLPEEEFYLGAIAPDIGKLVGLNKTVTHFQSSQEGLPNLNSFIKKYKYDLESTFTLGYFLHLYSDYIWFNEYVNKIYENTSIILKSTGEEVLITQNDFSTLIYGDYTNLNKDLIDYYKLDLSLFFNDVQIPKTKIEEIPLHRLQILVDKLGVILLEAGEEKFYFFEPKLAVTYINATAEGFLTWYQNIKESTN